MIIGFLRENDEFETRSMLLPDYVNSLIKLGFQVIISNDYAKSLNLDDSLYINAGAEAKPENEVVNQADVIVKISGKDLETFDYKEGAIIITGFFDKQNEKYLTAKNNKKLEIFGLNYLPRITRAQAMDVLSSQSNLAGYKAVIDTAYEFSKALPMMMTAAGTITPAKYFIIGAGVAGLQAIATAKRLGAIVSATDVRVASKEQVESLGGKFLMVEQEENLETAGGYAKEYSEEYKKKQADLLKEALRKNDIVICTALIPGKPAPKIINEELVKLMKPGSIIYDLAAEQGGNSAYSEPNKINIINGVKVIGPKSLMNKLPLTASNLYAKNLFSFVRNLYSKEKKNFDINLEDEIISKTLIKE